MRWPGRHAAERDDLAPVSETTRSGHSAAHLSGHLSGHSSGRPSGDRLLATARVDGGGVAVGTVEGLHVTEEENEGPVGVLLSWDRIDTASWDADEDVLTVRLFALDDEPSRSYALHLTEPGRLPELVRERVTSSILVDTRVGVGGGRGARVIARRRFDGNDPEWLVVYDEGIDRADPVVAERVQERITELRASLGV